MRGSSRVGVHDREEGVGGTHGTCADDCARERAGASRSWTLLVRAAYQSPFMPSAPMDAYHAASWASCPKLPGRGLGRPDWEHVE